MQLRRYEQIIIHITEEEIREKFNIPVGYACSLAGSMNGINFYTSKNEVLK